MILQNKANLQKTQKDTSFYEQKDCEKGQHGPATSGIDGNSRARSVISTLRTPLVNVNYDNLVYQAYVH